MEFISGTLIISLSLFLIYDSWRSNEILKTVQTQVKKNEKEFEKYKAECKQIKETVNDLL